MSSRAYTADRDLEAGPMPSPRLLVIEGNSPQTMAEHVAAGGMPASKGYSDLLRELLPGASGRHLLSGRSGRHAAGRRGAGRL